MALSRSRSVQQVLQAHTHADLAARYHAGMEVQVNVATPGNPRDGEPYNFRVPKNAKGDPEDNSGWNLKFRLLDEFEAIGITGWNFKDCASEYLGYDFDSIINHDAQHGRDEAELLRVVEAAQELPYVEVRKSTSGNGYHLWVQLDPDNRPETANHTEHAALARAVLQKMAEDADYPFADAVDCMGMVLWICARRATEENGGLSLVHAATEPLTDWPENWRDHLEVVSRKRKRARLADAGKEADDIDRFFADRPSVKPDATHRAFVEQYKKTEYHGYWHRDLGCYVAHTCGIREAFQQMNLRGVFVTDSPGTDPNKPNAWMYPVTDGAWRVYRFAKGTPEARTWETSHSGWTSCAINVTPSLDQVAAAFNGVIVPGSKTRGATFITPDDAEKAVAAFGGELGLPEWVKSLPTPRPITIKECTGGGLSASFRAKSDDESEGRALDAMKLHWTEQRRQWVKYLDVDTVRQQTDYQEIADNAVRHVARDGKQEALYVHTSSGWQRQDRAQVKAFLTHRGIRGVPQEDLLGWCAANPWEAVAIPFGPEHPGDRRWNLDGAKLLYAPSLAAGPTPHWDMILNHVGRGLDEAVESNEWCQERGIKTGADYLRWWAANVLRFPERRLPMLGMFSPEQNTGKSTFNEGLQELFDVSGYCIADKALTNERGFNQELNGKALCVIEETNLSQAKDAYSRLKSWITSNSLQIEGKGKDGFTDDNYTHWIMTCNNRRWIPIDPGDTRIVLWEVTPFEGEEIPRETLKPHLRDEAPYFLHELFRLDLSGVYGRHTLPVLMTPEKAAAMRDAETFEMKVIGGLEGKALKAAEAIVSMPKPWGPGSAVELCEVLGDWDGEASKKKVRSRAASLGRYMKKIEAHLAHSGIKLHIDPSGKTSRYSFEAAEEK